MIKRVLLVCGLAVTARASDIPESWGLLPEPMADFGAAVLDGWIYVYGGHRGQPYMLCKENQRGELQRCPLANPGADWESLATAPARQGVVLLVHQNQLVRVGGMQAQNPQGEKDDLLTCADVSRFEPTSGKWEEIVSLPEPRSSHGAALVEGQLYVVGGWSVEGLERRWHRTFWRADLASPKPSFEPLPETPFERRAVAVAALEGRLYVAGGLQVDGRRSAHVDVFDLAAGSWSRGPDLPRADFDVALLSAGGHLYVSSLDGSIWRLNDERDDWQLVTRMLFPRRAFELLPSGDGELLAVGGTGSGGHLRVMEPVTLEATTTARKPVLFEVPFPQQPSPHTQLALFENELIVYDAVAPAAHRVHVGSFTVTALEDVPTGNSISRGAVCAPTQEPNDPLLSRPRARAFFLLDGAANGETSRPSVVTYHFGKRLFEVSESFEPPPYPGAMLGCTTHHLWMLGGRSDAEESAALQIQSADLRARKPHLEPAALRLPATLWEGDALGFAGKLAVLTDPDRETGTPPALHLLDPEGKTFEDALPEVPTNCRQPGLALHAGRLLLYDRHASGGPLWTLDPTGSIWEPHPTTLPAGRWHGLAWRDQALFVSFPEGEEGSLRFLLLR